MAAMNLFIPITKIDEENRLVYGRVAAEEIDNSGEQCDYASSKPNFEKWSNDQLEASGGLSKGNLRVMHGPIAAGVFTDLAFDDDNRVIEGCAKVVDDNEWQKCLAGVYTGFSMGGRYEKRWSEGGVRKYTALPCEVSLVDKPCIKSATFMLAKADGSTEERLFKVFEGEVMYEPTNDEMLARAQSLAKAAGKTDGDWLEFKEPAIEELKAENLGKAADAPKDGDLAKAEHTDTDCKAGDDCEKCATAAVEKAANPGGDETGSEGAVDDIAKTDAPELTQGWKAKDGSFHLKKADAIAHNEKATAGPTLADQIADLGKALTADIDPVAIAVAAVAALDDDQFAKFSTDSERAVALSTVDLEKYVADNRDAIVAIVGPDLTKAAGVTDDDALAKVTTLTEENDLLKTQLSGMDQQLKDAVPAIAELRKQIDAIKATPLPGGPAVTNVIDKGGDRGGLGKADEGDGTILGALTKAFASGELTMDGLANMAIRASQQNGKTISAQ